MKYYGKAEEAARRLLQAFETGNLPQAMAQMFLRYHDDAPCRKWSWNNQLLVALMGYREARGFRQWEAVGRKVKKGERTFYILGPLFAGKKQKEDATAEECEEETGAETPYGFKGFPVFGYEQTEGEPLESVEVENWIATLPLLDVAGAWGLSVAAYTGQADRPLGVYRQGKSIALGVRNLSTWAHELIHAADDKNGTLKEKGQHWRSEAVAELGGAVLLECLGLTQESDRGGCWQSIRAFAEKENLHPLWVCSQVTDRVCKAVARVLEEAETGRSQRLCSEIEAPNALARERTEEETR